ncbi:VPLPA-CTERM protein sorting domain-containing protein [Roseovarius pacificus]|uniref:VPLPA-CTERM protein sorting domain-containing protein n=1 Tax=Roseovarius pacificus TaxID=337701 RepID=A0A1M7HQT2_9RHOB|nr:VPLPA-CTERM sorting domain-containing protein [Roseovarius pacificus]GGO60545.1 hypothetical protein GCM10011315_35220 [Roseovarius pacificus]SHM30693.1 VPLPA-CTERM protein sorting domain-containing protein [Roseovarius pacificus]
MSLFSKTKTFTAAVSFALIAGASHAATVEVSNQYSNTHGSYGHKSMTLTDDQAGSISASVGAFALSATGLGSFIAFCLDIDDVLRLSSQYDVTEDSSGFVPYSNTTELSLERKSWVQKLYDTAYSTLDLTRDEDSVGFQLALWEVVFEGDDDIAASGFDAGSGDFSASGYGDGVARANELLAGILGNTTQSYKLTFLESNDQRGNPQYSQNLVTASPVPLPAAGFLLIGALGGLAAVGRRKRA